MNYEAYLFDLDGTLVDSERLKGKALTETCNSFGANVSVDLYKEVMGQSWLYVVNHFFDKGNIKPNLNAFNIRFKIVYQELLLNDLNLNKNCKELLIKLLESNKILGVVSSASNWMVDQIISQLNLSDFFEIIITKEDVKKHKPDPEAYILALDKLYLSSDKVLVFEDSNPGIIAAHKAKCDSIAFKHEFNINHDFSLAIRTINDFDEILIEINEYI